MSKVYCSECDYYDQCLSAADAKWDGVSCLAPENVFYKETFLQRKNIL